MPVRDFDELTKEQADAVLAQTLAEHEPALSRLRARAGALGEEVDPGPDGLVPLWQWFLAWFDSGQPAGPDDVAPSWYVPAEGDGMPLSAAALAVVDEIGHYLADAVLRAVPDARWHVARRAKRLNYAYQNMPAVDVHGADLVPSWPVRALATKLALGADEARDPESLLAVYQRYAAM